MMMRTALVIGFWVVALTATARAGEVGVVVTGEGSMQPQLAAQIEGWLGTHGHTLVASPLPPDAITALVDCFVLEDQTCARGVIEKRAKTSTVVYARIDAKTTTAGRTVTLTAYWFEKGHAAIAERRTCDKCTDQSLRTTADDMMKTLAGSGAGDLGHMIFRSTPPGARISIDGQAIGVTPLDWDVAAGKHTVLIDKDGLEPASREAVVKAGTTATLEFALEPLGGTPRKSQLIPLGLMGLGGALLVTGGVLIAIHQDPGLDQPYMVRNSRPAGIGFAVGGAAVLGVGVYLYFFHHPERTTGPVASVGRDSGYIGWAGSF